MIHAHEQDVTKRWKVQMVKAKMKSYLNLPLYSLIFM